MNQPFRREETRRRSFSLLSPSTPLASSEIESEELHLVSTLPVSAGARDVKAWEMKRGGASIAAS